jgi:PAS domain S-box-containing protein
MSLSIIFQFAAAIMAIRMIRPSGAYTAWIILACGFIVQAIRRAVSLIHMLEGEYQGDMSVEFLGLVISILMALGIWKFKPLFDEINRSHQVLVDKGDELATLNKKLEEEAAARKEVEKYLMESELLFRTLADFTSDWEFWIAPDNKFRYISKSCKKITGYTAEQFDRDPALLNRLIHPEDRALFDIHREDISDSGETKPIDFRIITATGEERWLAHKCRQVLADDGTFLGWRASNRDITERKKMEVELLNLNLELEERVRLRTSDLVRLNKELEGFCYSISHELMAPITRLEGYSRILSESINEAGPDAIRHFADRISVSSKQLRSVIDSLLMLNRLSRSGLNKEKVDLSKMAAATAKELMETTGRPGVNIEIAPDIIVTGDREMLRICIMNLLSNAFKYTAKSDTPEIEFGKIGKSGAEVIFIRDNGVGFNMAYAKKLFQPFCRLHAEAEFAGDGIGLAVAQQVVERHGGRIWAEAEEGKGATFYFNLG